MFKMSINRLLKLFDDVNKAMNGTLLEISVKKSRINFEFVEGNLVQINNIRGILEDPLMTTNDVYFTSLNDEIRLTCDCENVVSQNAVPDNSKFYECLKLLDIIGTHICQCPALEYTISSNFVEVFIDKPNISSTDLQGLSDVFGCEFSLELQKQRPYCLFVGHPVDEIPDSLNTTTLAMDEEKFIEAPMINPSVLTSDMVRKI